jgi:hypothetical protein
MGSNPGMTNFPPPPPRSQGVRIKHWVEDCLFQAIRHNGDMSFRPSVRPNRRTTGTCDRRRASFAASLQSKMFQKLGRIIFIILLMNINDVPRKATTNRPSTSYCFDISIFILKDLK